MDIVDFHAHILPRADHGSSSVADSLCQLKMAKECGVGRVVATPHFYPARDSVDGFLERREKSYAVLMDKYDSDGVKIALGAEVLICQGIEDLPGLERLCIGNSRCILLELPFNDFEKGYVYSVREMIKRGYNVILAHADRYPEDNISYLIDCGAKIQLNAEALATVFKNKTLYAWMEMGLVVALGSDIHGRNAAAYKDFLKAQRKIGKHLDFIKCQSDKMWNSF